MDELTFEKIADVPAGPDGFVPVSWSPTDDGSLLFLFVEPSAEAAVTETFADGDFAIFPRPRMAAPKRFLAVHAGNGRSRVVLLPRLDVTFPRIDVFPDGRILVAGARSAWRGENDFDVNGIVCDPSTGSSKRILLGDGIEDVFVDRRGLVWVSYSDEGIFGNFGWGGPGPAPVGATGLACFSGDGEKIWEFPPQRPIFDCYALNVSGAEVAVFYDRDFPICRIGPDFDLVYWSTGLRGCAAFAISGDAALFAGQCGDPLDTGYCGILDRGRLRNVRTVRLRLPGGKSMADGRLVGRGGYLYFRDDVGAYRVGVDAC